MNTERKIITDVSYLRKSCEPVTVEEGIQLGKLLIEQLRLSEDAIGLSANQIGIRKRVCVIGVRKPIILVNPVLVGGFDKVVYREGCLSFKGETVETQRYKNILVKSDTQTGILSFYATDDQGLLESVCVQHEIDHLNGITMHDRRLAKGVKV
jgi:peptide deformylase